VGLFRELPGLHMLQMAPGLAGPHAEVRARRVSLGLDFPPGSRA